MPKNPEIGGMGFDLSLSPTEYCKFLQNATKF